jgi:pyridoxine 5-phosphate synthase
VVELHTGAYCDAAREGQADRAAAILQRLKVGAELAASLGLEVHAGHGIDYATVKPIAAIPQIAELNIGHFLIGEAIFVGLPQAMQRMRALMDAARLEVAA